MQVLALWITPEEEVKTTLFKGVQDDFNPDEHELASIKFMYFGMASCCQPIVMMRFPDDVTVPAIADLEGNEIIPNLVLGELP